MSVCVRERDRVWICMCVCEYLCVCVCVFVCACVDDDDCGGDGDLQMYIVSCLVTTKQASCTETFKCLSSTIPFIPSVDNDDELKMRGGGGQSHRQLRKSFINYALTDSADHEKQSLNSIQLLSSPNLNKV